MKKAKVVETQASRKPRFLAGKKAALFAVGAVVALGVVSVTVPTSNIPGFKYIAQLIGINADATRNLTMLDFASYAAGRKDNKIQELRSADLSYNGAGVYGGGGLSPFSTLNSDRLAEAYAKNSQEALEMEKSLGGQISPFDKATLDKEYTIDPASMAKGFDPAKLGDSSKAAYSGAMEALAAAAGRQAEAFGKPLKKEDLQGVANLVGLRDSNISNIVGGGNILSVSGRDRSDYAAILRNARALSATSIFGSVNPDFRRTDTRIGRPVYGMFKDLGNAFFFSRYAAGAKLPTAASDIAVAAFDGGSPEDQSIITKEEDPQAPGSSPNPEEELSQGAHNYNMCAQVSETYKDLLNSISQSITGYIKIMLKLTQLERVRNQYTSVPGCCIPIMGVNNRTLSARHKWNYYLYGGGVVSHMDGGAPDIDKTLYTLCGELRNYRNLLAGNCGIEFEEPEYTCQDMKRKLTLGSCGRKLSGKCQNITIFGDYDLDINISRKKWKKYQKRVAYYMSEDGGSYSEEQAIYYASIDAGFSEMDLNGNINTMCTREGTCLSYINDVMEKTFAIENIVDIRGILLEEYGEDGKNQLQQIRNWDAQQLQYCHAAGDMSDCQEIVDYYDQDMWEKQCSGTNLHLNKYFDFKTKQLKMSISQVAESDGQIIADCLVIYLAINGLL